MKLNCTKGPLTIWPHVNRGLFTNIDLRLVLDEQRSTTAAMFVSAINQDQDDVSREVISPQERDANAHLFAHAAEMLQLLLDQEAVHGRLITMSYDEAVQANVALARRRAELLVRLKEAGVISEEGS